MAFDLNRATVVVVNFEEEALVVEEENLKGREGKKSEDKGLGFSLSTKDSLLLKSTLPLAVNNIVWAIAYSWQLQNSLLSFEEEKEDVQEFHFN